MVIPKYSGEMKRSASYNDKPAREWICKEDKSSTTAFTESILLISAIDTTEKRYTVSLNVPNAFIEIHMTLNPDKERVIMTIQGLLVKYVIDIDLVSYRNKTFYEKSQRCCTWRY